MKVKVKELYSEAVPYPVNINTWPQEQYGFSLTRMGSNYSGVAVIHLERRVQRSYLGTIKSVHCERTLIDLYSSGSELLTDAKLIRRAIIAFDNFVSEQQAVVEQETAEGEQPQLD